MLLKTCTACSKKIEINLFPKKSGKCSICLSIYLKEYRKKHIKHLTELNRLNYLKNQEERKLNQRLYTLNNKSKISVNKKKYYRENKDKIIEDKRIYQNFKYNIDLTFRLKNVLRSRLTKALKSKGFSKHNKFKEYLGCDVQALRNHLESQFQSGMSWDNYGKNGWSIDHKKALANAKNSKEMTELCHYTNLQPMWALDNIRKGKR